MWSSRTLFQRTGPECRSAPGAVSKSQAAYTDLGDLDYEDQSIAEGTVGRVDSTYDQAGNRTQLSYPGGTALAYAPTALNQVDTVKVGVNPLVDYTYAGRKLQGRTTTTGAVGGTATYQQDWGYDSHRRINAITNSVDTGGGPQTVADYAFTHDAVGNPLSQVTVTGLLDFLGDDRLFGVDDLNRLVGTDYLGSGEAESTNFDLVGNREAHRNRKGETTYYGLVNAANEFPWIGDETHTVSYDTTGNLTVDEEGRRYSYDEQNRLTEVKEPLPATGTLARYTYDAVGRRIVFEDPIGGTTIRYYYDGVNAIEERDASDVLMRYHVNGAQYIDERVGTYDTGVGGLRAPGWSYYLLNDNFSIAGTGDGGGTIARLDYSATGDATGVGAGYYFDANGNNTIDLIDWASLGACLLGPDVPTGTGCGVHDFTRDGHVDLADAAVFQRYFDPLGQTDLLPLSRSGNYAHDWDRDRDVDLDDYAAFATCVDTPPGDPLYPSCLAVHDFDNWGVSDGQITWFEDFGGLQSCTTDDNTIPPTTPDYCFRAGPGGAAPTSGMFALHGQPVDVLADPDGPSGPLTALALQYSRARYFDLKHGRWLQRDPSGYTDGNNLYEAFGSNAVRFTDPDGKQVPIVAGYRIDEYTEMSRRAGIELGGTPEDQAALGRLGKTAGVVALNVIPYAFGGVPGVAVNLVTLSMVAPTSYYERQAQFMETTGQSLEPDQAFAIVVSDVSGVSTGYLIVSGEDLLTLAQASPDARVESLAHLGLALGTVKGTAAFLPTIRSGIAAAGGRTAGGVIGIEEAGGTAATRIWFERFTGEQLRFAFAEHAPVACGAATARAGLRAVVVGDLAPGIAGRFAELDRLGFVGDQLTPHHMPQAALYFTSREAGGAIVLPHAEHVLTRTYGTRGAILVEEEAGLPFRTVLARDIRDLRNIAGPRYNAGIRDLLDYYRGHYPELMAKPTPP